MRVAYGNGKRIGRIGNRRLAKREYARDHRLYLRLICTAVAADRLLYKGSRVGCYRQSKDSPRKENHPPRLTQGQRASGIACEKDFFDGHDLRLIGLQHFTKT